MTMIYCDTLCRMDRALARRQLDRRVADHRPELRERLARPPAGWVRGIRDALGLPARELAVRLGVSQPTVTRLEGSERAETITLRRLREVADALDCDLVYGLVPRCRLEDTVAEQARRVAADLLAPVAHTMALEGQDPGAGAQADELEALARDVAARPRELWSVRGPG